LNSFFIFFLLSLHIFLLGHYRNRRIFLHFIKLNDKKRLWIPLDEGSAHGRDIFQATQTFMTTVGFENTIPGIKWLYINGLDREATWIFLDFFKAK
jgi:hypothetical protein